MLKAADGIEREHIESSNIESIGYDPERKILAIEFKSSAIFHYQPFTLEQATDFYAAKSKGSYYSKHIKGKITSTKMTGPCNNCGIPGLIGTRCDACHQGTHVAATEKRKDDGQPETRFSG